jgi:protein-tyrosine phosphatase
MTRATLYGIEGPWPGRLAVVPRPRGGDWLEDEVQSWRQAGVNVVVSSLEKDEITEWNLAREADLCVAQGIEFVHFPIADRGVPPSFAATAALVRRLEGELSEGKGVAFHCRAGIGRSALLAACVLVLAGLDSEAAWHRVSKARGCAVPDTAEQRAWLGRFARECVATTKHGAKE